MNFMFIAFLVVAAVSSGYTGDTVEEMSGGPVPIFCLGFWLLVDRCSGFTWQSARTLVEYEEGTLKSKGWMYESAYNNSSPHPLGMVWEQNQNDNFVTYAYGGSKSEVEEQIDQLLHDLRQLYNEDELMVDDVESVFQQINGLLSLDAEIAFPEELLYLLHELTPRINLPDIPSADIVNDNVALLIYEQRMAANGITVARDDDDGQFTMTTFHSITGDVDTSIINVAINRAVMALPHWVSSFNQISFIVFRESAAFQDAQGLYTINSAVINVNFKEVVLERKQRTITMINIYLSPVVEPLSNMRRACVYWMFSQDGTGRWTEAGCTLITSGNPELLDYCECELIFTYYAEALFIVSPLPTDPPDSTTITDITIVPITTEMSTDYNTTPTKTDFTTLTTTEYIIPTTTEYIIPTTTEYITTPTPTEYTTTPTPTEYTTTPTPTEYTTTPTPTEYSTTPTPTEYTTTPTPTEYTTTPTPTEYSTTPTPTEYSTTPTPTEYTTTPTPTEYTTTPTPTEYTTTPTPTEYSTTPTPTEYSTTPTPTEYTTTPTPTEYTTTPTPTEYTTTPTPTEYSTTPTPTEYSTTPTPTEYTTTPTPTEYSTTPTPTEYSTTPTPTEYSTTPTPTEYTTTPTPTEYTTTPTPTEYSTTPTPTEYSTTPTPTEYSTTPTPTEYSTTPTPTEYSTTPTPTEYSTTPTPTEYSTTPTPTEYSTTPTPTEYSTTPTPTEYSTTPTPTEYSTTPTPTEYSTTPTPTEYSTTPTPTEYSTTPTPTEYSTTPTPTEYSTTPTPTEYSTTPTPTEYTTTPTPTEYSTTPTPTEYSTTPTPTEYTTIPTTAETTTTGTTTTIPPSEQIDQALNDLEQLLNQTDPIMVDDITSVFDQVNDILDLDQEDVEIPSELLQLLDDLAERIDLNGSYTEAAVRDNIALLMADVSSENPVRGIAMTISDTDTFADDYFIFLHDVDISLLNVNVSEAVVFLPPSVTSDPRRISFVVFRDARAFSFERQLYAVNSRVISVNVGDFTQFKENEVVNISLQSVEYELNRNERRICAYWSFLDDGTGYWSQEGCTLILSNDPSILDTCQCDHLTHFAEVLIRRPLFSQLNEDILEILSIIGCLLSIFGSIVIALTAILFRSWRKSLRNKIWLQLCTALLIMSICFLIIVFSRYDASSVSCILTGITLHYSILASFCWMLVVAVQSYSELIIIFIRELPHKILIASGFSWGVPVVIVGILLLVDPQSYSGRYEEMNPSSNFCYPSGTGLWVAVYTPIAVMLLVNWTIFFLIIRNIGVTPKNLRYQKAGNKHEALKCARVSVVLVFLFGLPWVFGLFAHNIFAAYLFTCTATIQGFILFLFIVCGNAPTRKLWLRTLRPKSQHELTRSTPRLPTSYNSY